MLWSPRLEVGSGPLFCLNLLNELSKEAGLGVSVKESRPVVDRISEVVSPILWALGLELVDVVCVGQGTRSVVRVYIDKSGGVTVDDCGRAHLAIGPALDVADPFPHTYTLEVSSPGSGSGLQTDSGLSPGSGEASEREAQAADRRTVACGRAVDGSE